LTASWPPERNKKHADFAKKIGDKSLLTERLRHAERKEVPIDFCQKIGLYYSRVLESGYLHESRPASARDIALQE
jgi:hypothetical protein